MNTITVGDAELRVLKKIIELASSGAHITTTKKERETLSQLHRRLIWGDK